MEKKKSCNIEQQFPVMVVNLMTYPLISLPPPPVKQFSLL